jgi:TolB-like protein
VVLLVCLGFMAVASRQVIAGASGEPGGKPRVVAVAPFEDATGEADLKTLGEALADLLAGSLGTNGVTVVERTLLGAVLAEQGLPARGPAPGETTVKFGRLLGADLILAGSFSRTDKGIRLNMQILEVRSGTVLRSVEETSALHDLEGLSSRIAAKVRGALDLGPAPAARSAVEEYPVANLHFFRGLEAYWQQRYDDALAEFMSARGLAPRNADAVLWIAKTYMAAGEWAHSWIELTRMEGQFGFFQKQAVAQMKAQCAGRLTADERRLLVSDAESAGSGRSP